MDDITHHGAALRCQACGATLSSSAPTRALEVCRNCGCENRHAPELLEDLAAHRRGVDDEQARAEGAQREHVQAEVSRSLGSGWALGLIVSWLLAGVASLVSTALALAVFAAPLLVFARVAIVRQRAVARRLDEARARPDALALHCPTCGGQSECRPEAPVLACRYCSGALAADQYALAELLARARASTQTEVHRARMAGWRLAGKLQREPGTDLVPYFVLGGLGSLWVIGTLITDLRALLGDAPANADLWLLNAISLVICMAVGVPLLRRRARIRRWSAAMTQLGEVQTALTVEAEWLCAHWRGELPSARIRGGRGYGFVVSTSQPRWAISLAPWSAFEPSNVRHVEVLVPGKRGPLLERWAAELASLGFECSWTDGGLVAALPTTQLRDWITDPRHLARLRATIDRLVV